MIPVLLLAEKSLLTTMFGLMPKTPPKNVKLLVMPLVSLPPYLWQVILMPVWKILMAHIPALAVSLHPCFARHIPVVQPITAQTWIN
jgi:hypothetical protein